MNTINITGTHKYLVIEDNPARIRWFKERLPIATTVYAGNPTEALIAASQADDVEVVFLDHDAVNIFWKPEDKEESRSTFIEAAKELSARGFKGAVVIHSLNHPGALRMQSMLRHEADVYIWKFGTFEIKNSETTV